MMHVQLAQWQTKMNGMAFHGASNVLGIWVRATGSLVAGAPVASVLTVERSGTSTVLLSVQEVVASQKAKPAGAALGVHYDIAPELVYEGYVHPFTQVVFALIENAHTHAFVGRNHGAMPITSKSRPSDIQIGRCSLGSL